MVNRESYDFAKQILEHRALGSDERAIVQELINSIKELEPALTKAGIFASESKPKVNDFAYQVLTGTVVSENKPKVTKAVTDFNYKVLRQVEKAIYAVNGGVAVKPLK